MITGVCSGVPETDPVSRCFRHFIDPIDGVLCVSADAVADEIATLAHDHNLRFPLILDSSATLSQQVNSSEYAPASSRFGAFCDNILGMNWKMPDGRIVRIGERVVKTTTGYDVFRFLLHSCGRFGYATDYVVRLRPDCRHTVQYSLSGKTSDVCQSIPVLLKGSWMHWFDSIDLLSEGQNCRLRLHVNCPPNESRLFTEYVSSFAGSQHLQMSAEYDRAAPVDGCPDFTFKTTPDRVPSLTTQLAQEQGIRATGLCYSGVVLGYLSKPGQPVSDGSGPEASDCVQPSVGIQTEGQDFERIAERIQTIVRQHANELYSLGGDWHSRYVPPPSPVSPESEWISILQKEAGLL